MNAMQEKMLKLNIINRLPQNLGVLPSYTFLGRGGSIGRSKECDWLLQDGKKHISNTHVAIDYTSGRFCLTDESTNGTSINGVPLGKGKRVRLQDGDKIRIGDYEIEAHIIDSAEASIDESMRTASSFQAGSNLEDMVSGNAPQTTDVLTLLNQTGENAMPDHRNEMPSNHGDGMIGVFNSDVTLRRPAEQDASGKLEANFSPSTIYAASPPPPKPSAPYAKSEEHSLDSYLDALRKGGYGISQEGTSPAPDNTWLTEGFSVLPESMSALWPLFKAMGMSGVAMDPERLEQFLTDVGTTLQRAINGLQDIYNDAPSSGTGFRVAVTQLQPVEDNPIRFTHNVAEAINALFGQRKAVHLAPADAVTESLEGIRHHNHAVASASSAALMAVLQSFSPTALIRRFEKYAPAPADAQACKMWAWEMFSQYYEELERNNCAGPKRLFDEVFQHAYDRTIRSED